MPSARAVVLIALGFGLLFAFVIPPLGGLDEPLHFLRAWQVSDGTVLPVRRSVPGGRTDLFARVPSSLPREMRSILRDGLLSRHDGERVWHHLDDAAPRGPKVWEGMEGAGAYSPVPYVPAAIAIRAGRTFGLSTLALVQLARIAQVLAYALLAGLAVRRMRYRALVLAVIALTPVALIQAGTVSADPVTLGLTLLVLAETSTLLARSAEIGPSLLVEVGAAVVALALAKPPYLLVAALLVVPAWRHRGRIGAALGGSLAVALGCAVAWNRWAQSHYVLPLPGAAELGFSYAYHNVSPTRQTRYVRENPWGFVKIIGRTLARYTGSLVRDTFAQSPSWQVPLAWVVVTIAVFAAALALSPRSRLASRSVRVLALVIAAALFVAVFFLAYVGWNAVGAPRVDALQGRYLLPVVALLAIVVAPGFGIDRARGASLVLAGSGAVALAVAIGIAHFVYF